MTIITQNGLILNYRYIREIGLYDAKDDDNSYFCIISAKNERGEELNLAVYPTSDEGEAAYDKFIDAFMKNAFVFSFAMEDPVMLKEQTVLSESKAEPDKSSYKNRFIGKDR